MRPICQVDVSALLPLLGLIQWRGVGYQEPWSLLPFAVKRESELIVAQVLLHLPGRRRGLTWIGRRVPGEELGVHIDREDANCRERVHVPLLTNPHAKLWQAGEWHHLPVGRAYLFDPCEPHMVANRGETDRVHLYFNAVPLSAGETQN